MQLRQRRQLVEIAEPAHLGLLYLRKRRPVEAIQPAFLFSEIYPL